MLSVKPMIRISVSGLAFKLVAKLRKALLEASLNVLEFVANKIPESKVTFKASPLFTLSIFVSSGRVSTDRMVYEGKGIHDPVASNDTPEGRSLNRRVEIVILANQKMIQEAQQGTLR